MVVTIIANCFSWAFEANQGREYIQLTPRPYIFVYYIMDNFFIFMGNSFLDMDDLFGHIFGGGGGGRGGFFSMLENFNY